MKIIYGINKVGGSREENFHFHDLRRMFGSELLKRGANPYHIKDLFAHSARSYQCRSPAFLEPL